MNSMDLDKLNLVSPYTVWSYGDAFRFKTDNDILYMVSFDLEEAITINAAYWFNLANISDKKSPNDTKIAQTVAFIIEAFFKSNPNILLYMCDTLNDQQAQRDRLFLHWFHKYVKEENFIIKTATIEDDGVDNYLAMIVQTTNPQLNEIVNVFNAQVSLFKENK